MLGIDAHHRPDVHAAAVLPAVLGPGVVAELSRPGHGMESPHRLARAHVVGAHVSVRPTARGLLERAPRDHDVLVDRRRRRDARAERGLLLEAVAVFGAKVDRPALTEVGTGPARARVDRHEPAVDGAEDDAPRAGSLGQGLAFPVGDAAMRVPLAHRLSRLRVEGPELSAGLGLEGDDPRGRGREVQHSPDQDRGRGEARLEGRQVAAECYLPRVVGPGALELPHVVAVDVVEWRIADTSGRAPPVAPFGRGRLPVVLGAAGARGQDQERGHPRTADESAHV